MGRSIKKGPYVDKKLLKKVKKAKEQGSREPIKTWARSSQISPDMVGVTLSIHNGKNFISVFVTEPMVGHRVGEFSPTRTFKGHGSVAKRILSPT